ncbi:MAG: hypothetical protein HRU76_04395 [Phycisphaeraceae bacterium]|nr:hypothetical protein [Phycisphaerales bacterium]QOJ16872.1 MAG: hypothetical protein HRU76_04395 [Phycisphaeraceae bacterium]
MVKPTGDFIDELESRKRRAIDALTFEQRGWAGLGMFDLVAESIRAGIRMKYPHADEQEVHERFLQRMREVREGPRRS